MSKYTEATRALVRQIEPLLSGKDASVQGAALGELTATWLFGHIVVGDPEATRRLRRQMLGIQMALIVELIAAAERERRKK